MAGLSAGSGGGVHRRLVGGEMSGLIALVIGVLVFGGHEMFQPSKPSAPGWQGEFTTDPEVPPFDRLTPAQRDQIGGGGDG